MYFLLKSEVETIDIEKDYYKKRLFCPFCGKTQLKKLNSNELYNKYHCWNKDCEKNNVPFVVLNKYIQEEDLFSGVCESCQQPLHREFSVGDNHAILIFFRCNSKMCESNMEPYCYNLTKQAWQGKKPKFILYDDLELENKPNLIKKEILSNPVQEPHVMSVVDIILLITLVDVTLGVLIVFWIITKIIKSLPFFKILKICFIH